VDILCVVTLQIGSVALVVPPSSSPGSYRYLTVTSPRIGCKKSFFYVPGIYFFFIALLGFMLIGRVISLFNAAITLLTHSRDLFSWINYFAY